MDRVLKMALAIILALVILPVLGASCSGGSIPAQAPQEGSLAPDFHLPSLDGQNISLRDLRGKPVMLNFWASWCGPCRAEMPLIQEVFDNKEGSDSGLVMLAVNIGESPDGVNSFMAENGFSFPVLLDTSQEVAREYNIRGIPTTFFIDKDGIIKDIKIGAIVSKTEMGSRLSKIAQ